MDMSLYIWWLSNLTICRLLFIYRLIHVSFSPNSSEFLYPSQNNETKELRQTDGQYEKFMLVEKTIKKNMAAMVAAAPLIQQQAESMLAGSIAMALCYIARLQREKPPGFKLNARILVVTGSLECASQYMTYMNVFFTAQKQNVVLDVCALDESMTLLQQGCDITGGQYLKLPQTEGLLQYLMVSESLQMS